MEPHSILEDNNKLSMLIQKEKIEKINILKALRKKIRLKIDAISLLIEKLEYFDIVWAKARLAISMKAEKPLINDNGILKLYNARHPMLKEKAVPINLLLGESYNILIITGPNTAGKTLAIKTLGPLSIMTMRGMLIPVDKESSIPIIDLVFIDSKDEQSIEYSLSSFSSHIKRIIDILKKATSRSLVLIDEIGSGRDPDEGRSIALAILEELKKK